MLTSVARLQLARNPHLRSARFNQLQEGAAIAWQNLGVSNDPLLACAGLSADELVEVLALVAGTDICELDVTLGATHFSLRRPAVIAHKAAATAAVAPAEPSSLAITSPLVGIFRPSVSTGENVQPGQSIGAIEVLGMPSSVDAPQGGTVEELLVSEGSPVEYGQPLLILRRTGRQPVSIPAVES